MYSLDKHNIKFLFTFRNRYLIMPLIQIKQTFHKSHVQDLKPSVSLGAGVQNVTII